MRFLLFVANIIDSKKNTYFCAVNSYLFQLSD